MSYSTDWQEQQDRNDESLKRLEKLDEDEARFEGRPRVRGRKSPAYAPGTPEWVKDMAESWRD